MNGPTILVVDDERSISEVISLYLTRAGYRVKIANDGQSALKELARQMPDLVVLDLMLPEVDGLEITRRLRAVGDTPIIMVTAVTEKTGFKFSPETDGEYLPADDYISKPVPVSELLARVNRLLAVQGG